MSRRSKYNTQEQKFIHLSGGGRAIHCAVVGLVAAAVSPLAASAQPAAPLPPVGPVGDATPGGLDEPGPPDWRWRQVAAALRTQGRFTVVEVDPRNPQFILVGTEEGTLMRSDDGGVTWREIEPAPNIVQRYSFAPKVPGLPKLGDFVPPEYQVFIDPPFSTYPERLFIPFETLFFGIRPEFVRGGFMPKQQKAATTILKEATAQRSRELNAIKSIAYCPGAPYPIIIASWTELYGSADDALTFVRLFAIPGKVQIHWARCNPNNPLEVAVGTDFGLFLSADGGMSFDQDLTGWPGQPATAVEWRRSNDPKLHRLYAATGDVIFAGDPYDDEGLRFIYPDFNNAETAPWTTIYDIVTTPSGQVWAGTEDGLRVSFDGGKNWKNIARTLLGRAKIRKLYVGWDEHGGERVVAVLGASRPRISGYVAKGRVQGPLANVIINPHPPRDWVYATDDRGKTWHPFFNDLSRRTIRHATSVPPRGKQPAQWWVVTRGELWATAYVSDTIGKSVDKEAAEWARAKLAATPSLDVVIRAIIDSNYISGAELEHFFARARDVRPYVPRLDVQFSMRRQDINLAREQLVTAPYFLRAARNRVSWSILLELKWFMPKGGLFLKEESGPVRLALYELNRQLRFIAEDTWHERHVLLTRLAQGMVDELEIEVLRARIESLEAILEVWIRQPMRNLLSYDPWEVQAAN